MPRIQSASKIQDLELQLEEALQILRLVAQNKRTILEVEEWLKINYPDSDDNSGVDIAKLLKSGKGSI
jgi:hypothetical protein